jgi:hypothetical protein
MTLPPPEIKLGGKCFCSYTELRECHYPAMLPVDEVQIETLRISDIGLGKIIYTIKQLDEFASFQDSKGKKGHTSLKPWRWLTTEEVTKENED